MKKIIEDTDKLRGILFSCSEKTNIIKIFTLPKTIYTQSNLCQNPNGIIHRGRKISPKIHMEPTYWQIASTAFFFFFSF